MRERCAKTLNVSCLRARLTAAVNLRQAVLRHFVGVRIDWQGISSRLTPREKGSFSGGFQVGPLRHVPTRDTPTTQHRAHAHPPSPTTSSSPFFFCVAGRLGDLLQCSLVVHGYQMDRCSFARPCHCAPLPMHPLAPQSRTPYPCPIPALIAYCIGIVHAHRALPHRTLPHHRTLQSHVVFPSHRIPHPSHRILSSRCALT